MTTPQENFGEWLKAHYDWIGMDGDSPHLVCKRCGATVSYLTKHAAVRHGDPIEVMPAANGNRDLAQVY